MRSVDLKTPAGRAVCERCLVADSPFARMRGLLGRRGLDRDEGVLLRPASSVHTFFMRFPIDVVFLSREGEVLKIVPDLGAWRTASCRGAKAVVELRAGAAAARDLRVGTRLELPVRRGRFSGPAAGHPPVSA
jgi:uncharacterized membrane protein (UPF0127 family)